MCARTDPHVNKTLLKSFLKKYGFSKFVKQELLIGE